MPSYAVLEGRVLDDVERDLSRDEDGVDLDEAFERFERTQPHLASRVGTVLGRPLDETALALGYFLSIAIWLAFDRAFGDRVQTVTEDALKATEDALALEEELRADDAREPLEIDDVVAQEQPGVLAFVHDHVEAALETDADDASADEEKPPREVDVDDVHAVYRTMVVLTLAHSHAVTPPDAATTPPAGGPEMLA